MKNQRKINLIVVHCSATRVNQDFPVEALEVSIRSTPYCISQNNVVSLHDGIIFLILKQEYEV